MSAPSGIEDRPLGNTPDNAWAEYLAAAQRLDTVRRSAAAIAGEQARSVQTAQQTLITVRARLAPQQSRLRALGIPEAALQPTSAEVAAAGAALAGDPGAALAALEQAQSAADAADVAASRSARLDWSGRLGRVDRSADWQPWLPNLLIWVVLAMAVIATLACVGLGTVWLQR